MGWLEKLHHFDDDLRAREREPEKKPPETPGLRIEYLIVNFLKVDQCQPHENFWTARQSFQVVN